MLLNAVLKLFHRLRERRPTAWPIILPLSSDAEVRRAVGIVLIKNCMLCLGRVEVLLSQLHREHHNNV